MAMAKQVTGWFDMPGRPGDRTFEQQLLGLNWLFEHAKDKMILDLGCAEGLISMHLAEHCGARFVHGVELVEDRVRLARKIAGKKAIEHKTMFEVGDAETWKPQASYDIVIGLAILHKLKNPSACAARLAECAKEAVVLRLPPANAPSVVDRRSGHVPHHIGKVIEQHALKFHLGNNDGPYGEWVGVWTR